MPLTKQESDALFNQIMENHERMFSFPNIVLKILKEIENPDSKIKDFQLLICNDSILTAKILRLANSAFYGHPRGIDTISEALIIIGLNALKSIVVADSLYTTAFGEEAEGYQLKRGELWAHSITTAIAASLIVEYFKYNITEKYFLAGLLHDIGKMLLGRYINIYINEIKNLVKNEKITFEQAENQILGFNHNKVGEALCNLWELPILFSEVAKYHHQPSLCTSEYKPIIEVVHIADIFSYRMHVGVGIDQNGYKLEPRILEQHNISKEVEKNIMRDLKFKYKEFFKSIFSK